MSSSLFASSRHDVILLIHKIISIISITFKIRNFHYFVLHILECFCNDVTLHIFVKGAVQRTVTSAACSGILPHQAVFPGENASKEENCEPQCYGHGASISIKKLALNVIYSTIILFRIEIPHQAVIFVYYFRNSRDIICNYCQLTLFKQSGILSIKEWFCKYAKNNQQFTAQKQKEDF